jgi:hypothetical protein
MPKGGLSIKSGEKLCCYNLPFHSYLLHCKIKVIAKVSHIDKSCNCGSYSEHG